MTHTDVNWVVGVSLGVILAWMIYSIASEIRCYLIEQKEQERRHQERMASLKAEQELMERLNK